MSTRRDKEVSELLNWLNRGEKPPPIASRVGKFIFFPRGPISRVVGTLLFSIMAGATVGSAALFVVSIGAIVAGVWLGPSDRFGLGLAGMGGIVLAMLWTFANFRKWAATEREVGDIERLAEEYIECPEEFSIDKKRIMERLERLGRQRLTPDQWERMAIACKNMDAAEPELRGGGA
jgi:hypothetical protein